MKREYNINDFRMNGKTITADGRVDSYTGKFDVNTSSILTTLIQEAGRYCERFASDLFIDWKSVERFIEEAEVEDSKSFLFGFRKDGVDHDNFIFSRYSSEGTYAQYNYRSLWRLDIETYFNEYGSAEMVLTLGRVF